LAEPDALLLRIREAAASEAGPLSTPALRSKALELAIEP
jgi:hypothetical protein